MGQDLIKMGFVFQLCEWCGAGVAAQPAWPGFSSHSPPARECRSPGYRSRCCCPALPLRGLCSHSVSNLY